MKRRNAIFKAIAAFAIAAAALCANVLWAAAAPSPFNRGEEQSAPQTMLAYVAFGQHLGDGLVLFFVDEVLWVHDTDLPNDYGIDNSTEEWIAFFATRQTAYSMWQFVSEGDVGFMESVEMSDDEFFAQLLDGWREGVLLAEITVSVPIIESIFEVYTP